MSLIIGTQVPSVIVPLDTADTYPTHDEQYGNGGYRSALTLVARNAIPAGRRAAGMLVYVFEDNTVYQLGTNLTTWTKFQTGGGTTAFAIARQAFIWDDVGSGPYAVSNTPDGLIVDVLFDGIDQGSSGDGSFTRSGSIFTIAAGVITNRVTTGFPSRVEIKYSYATGP